MSKRYRALRGLDYPANATVLKRVIKAGGLSKMSPEERATLKYKRVEAGRIAVGIPKVCVPKLLASGKIEEVT